MDLRTKLTLSEMISASKSLCYILLLLSLASLCTYCQPTASDDRQAAAGMSADTVDVTSFNVERENSPALANWAVFEVGQEIICVPPAWTSHLEKEGEELVLLPPHSPDSTERVTFTRLAKDNSSLDYPAFARQLVTKAFPNFQVVEGDTLKKLVFQQDFGIERNVGLRTNSKRYKGYCLVYVNERFIYQFRVILAQNRLNEYKGDLLQDILVNLQIDKKYFFGNDNPIKQVIYLH